MGPIKPPKIKTKPPKPTINISGKGTKPSSLHYYDSGLIYDTAGLYYDEIAGTFPVGKIPAINANAATPELKSARFKNGKIKVNKPTISIKDIL
jgi:hypothetical protein